MDRQQESTLTNYGNAGWVFDLLVYPAVQQHGEIQFDVDIHGDFDDPLNFNLAPPAGRNVHIQHFNSQPQQMIKFLSAEAALP